MTVNSVGGVLGVLKRLTDTKSSTEPMAQHRGEKPRFEPIKNTSPLERSSPEEQGVPSSLLLDLVKRLREDPSVETHNLMILRHGRVILESAFDDGSLAVWKQTYSACKSITALAVGFALQEGLFTTETKLIDIFPEESGKMSKISHKDITVHHLLTMTSTVAFGEADTLISDGWIKDFMNASVKGRVGESFSYNSLNTYMLGAAVCRLSGKTLTEYLSPRLLEPLGIKNIYWEMGPDGIEKGGWGMYITAEDLAKLGLLVMNGGAWEGKQLLRREYIEEMTSLQVRAPESYGRFNYGYQVWCGRDTDSFLFSGMLDQNVLGFRDRDLLIVANSGNTAMFQQSGFFKAVFDCFENGSLSDSPLPENKKDAEALSEYLGSCQLYSKKEEPLPSQCALLDGAEYTASEGDSLSTGLLPLTLQMVYNNYTKGLCSISFQVKDGKFYVLYREKDALHKFPVGFGRPKLCNMKFRGCVFRVAVSGEFRENEDGIPVLKLRLAFSETPCIRYLKFFFNETEALACHTETPGMTFAYDGIFGFKRSLEDVRFIRGAVGMVDDDYLDYKIKRTFSPRIAMKKKRL